MTNRAQGPLSCLEVTEVPVQDLPKSVSGNLRNLQPLQAIFMGSLNVRKWANYTWTAAFTAV